jgi:imidazoleglycerol-phosphate dehydratase
VRTASITRTTNETSIELSLMLEGSGIADVATGLPFFDHMLAQLGKHAGFDLRISAKGDLEVDAHHTVEDCGIAFGQALAETLGEKQGIARFGSALVPLDEACCEAALDLSGRPYLVWEVETGHERIGAFDPHLAEHFWRSVTQAAGITLHVRQRAGTDPHHVLECAFKACARALRDAVREVGGGIPSTKGTL